MPIIELEHVLGVGDVGGHVNEDVDEGDGEGGNIST